MNKNGAIVIVEDDADDQEIFTMAFKKLNYNNEIVFFNDGQEALAYLTAKTSEPFIVFSENEDIRIKTIPYLFFSTSAKQEAVVDAYSKSIQGFFVKPSNFKDFTELIRTIIEYWKNCVSPNYVK